MPACLASAGNDDSILIGGHAALTGGAVTATVYDGSAAWYNPAGLARASRQTLDLNASAYGVSLIAADGLFVLPDGTRSDASVVDWQLIPSALSYTRQLSARTVAAFSVMIPTTTDADLRTSIEQGNGTRWILAIDSWRNEYDYLLTLGSRLTDAWRLGVTLGGVYISSEQMVQLGLGRPGENDTSFLSYSNHRTTGDYGLRVIAGVQWTPTPRLDLGLSVQAPALTGFRKINETEISSALLADVPSATFDAKNVDGFDAVWEFSTPLVVRLGMAYAFGRAQVMIDGSVLSALETQEDEFDRKLAGNVRVATLIQLSDKLAAGGGVFTDLNGSRQPGIDFIGLAGGVRLSSNYRIAEDGRPLTFFTTLAGRYAYGWGYTEGVSFDPDLASAEGDFASTDARTQSHELAFNLGGGVTF